MKIKCPKCAGKGLIKKYESRCFSCRFEGSRGCDCGGSYTVPCDNCESTGMVKQIAVTCPRCDVESFLAKGTVFLDAGWGYRDFSSSGPKPVRLRACPACVKTYDES